MMTLCRWPKGCDQPVSLVEGRDDDLCFYHAKLLHGLIDASPQTYRRPRISSSQVLSDEQRELAEALQALGASPEVIRSALSKPA